MYGRTSTINHQPTFGPAQMDLSEIGYLKISLIKNDSNYINCPIFRITNEHQLKSPRFTMFHGDFSLVPGDASSFFSSRGASLPSLGRPKVGKSHGLKDRNVVTSTRHVHFDVWIIMVNNG